MGSMELINKDCLEVLSEMPENTVDSLVTDPPAGISFMGKDWDSHKGGRDQWIGWLTKVMNECRRVMKPGAHGFVWAIPRNSHWTATALENAGFEIRDVVTHVFGSGFPKSYNISKGIDRSAGAERQVIWVDRYHDGKDRKEKTGYKKNIYSDNSGLNGNQDTAPATRKAKQWDGWGTALKPASEHWILVRKPLSEKTIVSNVLKYGTGGINIDGSRIGTETITTSQGDGFGTKGVYGTGINNNKGGQHQGRFPANFMLSHSTDCEPSPHVYPDGSTENQCSDKCAVKMLDEQSGTLKSGKVKSDQYKNIKKDQYNTYSKQYGRTTKGWEPSVGGASRFFYCAKASKSERNKGLEGITNDHPTIKAQKLMRYLINMITPPGGIVLDPFMGSGSTGIAARDSGFDFLGIERELEYFEIAHGRIK